MPTQKAHPSEIPGSNKKAHHRLPVFGAPFDSPFVYRHPRKRKRGPQQCCAVRGWLTRRGTGPRWEMFNPAERWLSRKSEGEANTQRQPRVNRTSCLWFETIMV